MQPPRTVALLCCLLIIVPSVARPDSDDSLGAVRKLANEGSEEAQTLMAIAYVTGQGVPQDYVEAARWFHMAAEQGDPFAQFFLGVAYGEGQGVPRDYVQAYMWFDLAGRLGNERGFTQRDEIAGFMTAEQIGEARELAGKWKAKP